MLHVVCDDDPNWWQAYRGAEEAEHEADPVLPGLVPSPAFQLRKTQLLRHFTAENAARLAHRGALDSGGFLCFRNCFRRKKSITINDPAGILPTVSEYLLFYGCLLSTNYMDIL